MFSIRAEQLPCSESSQLPLSYFPSLRRTIAIVFTRSLFQIGRKKAEQKCSRVDEKTLQSELFLANATRDPAYGNEP